MNSTAQGGGVAEMLRTLPPYWRGENLDARWLVLEAPRPFFAFTKRLHNLLHGVPVSIASARRRRLYDAVSTQAGRRLRAMVRPGDVVVLEDPQVAGLAPELAGSGAVVVWRSHVGTEQANEHVEEAWQFLRPRIEGASAFLFSRGDYIPDFLVGRAYVVPPAIDPLSAKNQELTGAQTEAILRRIGLADGRGSWQRATVTLRDGRTVTVRRRANVLREGGPPRLGASPLVVALARWDWLKDPVGILTGFARHLDHPDARLVVAGPAAGSVADDPGGRGVLRATRAAWHELPAADRARIDVVSLPMVDLEENALMVNALQRRADVVVKKSLQEGFGLGVTEGLWKSRPVVATGVGGHKDQIEHGRSGLLLEHPADLHEFAAAVDELLADEDRARALAAAGREHVRENFLADSHFVNWIAVLRDLT
ncbi:MAG TPA: glycosyltransferase [Solirubrobacterales bacterium]|nr:glycosyltransferase [Solirubrobacterales bacterium]